ncbi:hypothetical protein GCM10009133_35200 [Cocleimonas flava]|uniref:Dolichyl-phosphate-mannose-protein mannosyltransferase n=1 Tax=Cocleimonas flava TaxID=634765 RepID=A0A4R1F9T1_9GAMM|nr:hypothetical protein [Cocleimonas flava]TCJ88638.1 hypothetical protein EV695_0496 [Cocleimonas flava]
MPIKKRSAYFLPIVYMLVFFIYEIVGFINSYVINLKGATKDAEVFHQSATEWALNGTIEFAVNAQFYTQTLGILYRAFGADEYLAVQLNIFAILGTMYFMNKVMIILEVEGRYRIFVILVIALWPSYITRASTSMREPLMIFMYSGFIYTYLRLRIRSTPSLWLKLLFFSFFMFSLHKAFAVLIFVAGLIIIYDRLKSTKINSAKGMIVLFFISGGLISGALLLTYLSSLNVAGLRELNSLVNNDQEQINTILEYKAGIDERASYGTRVEFNSPLAFLKSYPVAIINYLFQPFPTRISNMYDLYAFLEAIWRAYALFIVWKFRKNIDGATLFLVGMYFATTMLWAAGTTNYGTSSRHHLTHNWLLVIIFAKLFLNKTSPPNKNIRY